MAEWIVNRRLEAGATQSVMAERFAVEQDGAALAFYDAAGMVVGYFHAMPGSLVVRRDAEPKPREFSHGR